MSYSSVWISVPGATAWVMIGLIVASNWLCVFPGRQICLKAAVKLGFQPLPPDRIKSDFLGGWNGWKPSWASDSHAIESRIVRAICLATPFRRQPWAGTEAEFVQDLQLHFAPALSGLSVEGAADRQGWRRSSRDPLHAHL